LSGLPLRAAKADRVPATGATTVSILAPRDRHDALVRERVAPLVRECAALPSLDAVYFERVNKPHWGLRIRILGDGPGFDAEVRALAQSRLAAASQPFAIVDDEAEDKWVGGPAEETRLKGIHHLDSLASLDLLDIEAGGALTTSRAQWSLLVVERLLDVFGIHGVERLDFYRRGFEWAPSLGRWDAEVFAALERKFEAQAGGLKAAIDVGFGRDVAEVWGGVRPAQIAARFLEAVSGPVGAACSAATAGPPGKSRTELALFIAHAHSNRLGIHATQEATIRYLVFRARGGAGPHAS
jgi:thiopeptide-type bacteriocin biosynthesis protein